jgi:hypothetical protein
MTSIIFFYNINKNIFLNRLNFLKKKMTTTSKSNFISEKRNLFISNEKKNEFVCQGTQTDPEITQQAFTQAAISENLFLLLTRQKEDSNLVRNLFFNRNNDKKKPSTTTTLCKTIGCKKIARNNSLKFCKSHWNQTFPCKLMRCKTKRINNSDYCSHHLEQLKNGKHNLCNVENCTNLRRRRGVCDKHFKEGKMK